MSNQEPWNEEEEQLWNRLLAEAEKINTAHSANDAASEPAGRAVDETPLEGADSPDIMQKGLRFAHKVGAPNWIIEDEQFQQLADGFDRVIEKHFGGYGEFFDKWGLEVSLVFTAGTIVLGNVMAGRPRYAPVEVVKVGNPREASNDEPNAHAPSASEQSDLERAAALHGGHG